MPHPTTPVSAAAPVVLPATAPPHFPGGETLPMTNIRPRTAAGPVAVATGMDMCVLTQVMTHTPFGAGSVMSEMTMSVGVLPTGARVDVTPTTTTRHPRKTRSEGGKGSSAPTTKKPPRFRAGRCVVVERQYIHHRVLPNQPGRSVPDQFNRKLSQLLRTYLQQGQTQRLEHQIQSVSFRRRLCSHHPKTH